MSGKGSSRKKMPIKARAAMIQGVVPLSARFATFKSASITMITTAALIPRNSMLTSGTEP